MSETTAPAIPASTAPAPAAPPAAIPAAAPPASSGRPDFIPEKFWNPETASPRVEDLAKSYSALESKLGKARDEAIAEHERNRLAGRPEKPEAYAVAMGDGMLPGDVILLREKPAADFKPEPGKAYFLLDEADPLLSTFRKTAFDTGMSPEQFNGLVAQFVAHAATRVPTEEQRLSFVKDELAKIGPDGPQRAIALGAQLETVLGKEAGQAVVAGITSAPMLTAIEGLMRKVNGIGFTAPAEGGAAAAAVTADSLRERALSIAHLPDHDPGKQTALREIEDGYKRLYPGSRRT